MPTLHGPLPTALFALLGALSAHAYSFNFTSTPRQCRDLSLVITGSGTPPYRVTIIPFGPTPLSNSVEARRIIDTQFNDSSTLSFPLHYPENSQFIAVVSDKSGFGTGGASLAATVLAGDSGCFDTTTSVSAPWYLDLNPRNQLIQCTPGRIWWDPSKTQGDVTFNGVIPGGTSFDIPKGQVTTVSEYGDGFNWAPSIKVGTIVIVLGNDQRGIGSGGSSAQVISQGTSLNNTCLNDASPSQTPAPAAGGAYPTSTSGSGTGTGGSGDPENGGSTGGGSSGSSGSSGGSKTNIGAIVGGVVGGVVGALALALLLLFCLRRRKFHKTQKERPVDLLQDGERDSRDGHGQDELPQYYRPEPFLLPDPVADGGERGPLSAAGRMSAEGRPSEESATTQPHQRIPPSAWAAGAAGGTRPRTPDRSSTGTGTRKSGAGPTPLRPVNIVQHEDARRIEPTKAEEGEPETIELPPAYTHIRRGPSARVPPARDGDEHGTNAGTRAAGAPAEGGPIPNPPAPAPVA